MQELLDPLDSKDPLEILDHQDSLVLLDTLVSQDGLANEVSWAILEHLVYRVRETAGIIVLFAL